MDINDLTYKVIGCAYKVHNTLGPGFLEKVYENAVVTKNSNPGRWTVNANRSKHLSGLLCYHHNLP